jgi:hypothetical protein
MIICARERLFSMDIKWKNRRLAVVRIFDKNENGNAVLQWHVIYIGGVIGSIRYRTSCFFFYLFRRSYFDKLLSPSLTVVGRTSRSYRRRSMTDAPQRSPGQPRLCFISKQELREGCGRGWCNGTFPKRPLRIQFYKLLLLSGVQYRIVMY